MHRVLSCVFGNLAQGNLNAAIGWAEKCEQFKDGPPELHATADDVRNLAKRHKAYLQDPRIPKSGQKAWSEAIDAVVCAERMHEHGGKALKVDDLLATGGTMEATVKLVKQLGGEIAGLGFAVELDFLKGRDRFAGYDVFSLLHYDE